MDGVIRDSCENLYSYSGLPDFRDNPFTIARDTYNYFEDFTDPSLGTAYDAYTNYTDYVDFSERQDNILSFAMDGIANTYFAAIEGLDC